MKAVCNIFRKGKKSQTNAAVRTDNLPEIIKLVDKAARGDFEAFGQLYDIYLDRIYRYVLYQVKDRMTAEDITEEVFIKAWKAIVSCKGKGQTFSSWIYRIAHNHTINSLRDVRKYTSIEMENITEFNSPNLEFEMTQEQQELLDAVAELPENQGQVITLKFVEGLENREIAKIMGKSEGAIRILQLRALTTLRQKIGGGKNGTRYSVSESIG
jgi:RNA polymerase sigma-70 factor (ECF subfamily)